MTSTTALLLCNGEAPDPTIAAVLREKAALLCCADGGAQRARELGWMPHLVVGDLDSIGPDLLRELADAGVDIQHLSGQEDTDLEKCLKVLRDRGMHRILILSATGGLLDHAFGNFSILARYASHLDLVLFDHQYRIDILARSITARVRRGDRVSIVPLPRVTGVTYSGLRYPLFDATLEFGSAEGTCNMAEEECITIDIRDGVYALFRTWNLDEECRDPES